MEINLISKEELKNNLIIISFGDENREIDDAEYDNVQEAIGKEINNMKLGLAPSILTTRQKVNVDHLKKEYTKFNRFEIMDI